MQNSKLGVEISSEGFEIGKDPRTMSKDELNAMGHIKRSLRAVIRAKCLDCCGAQESEVRKCTATSCDLWPYRMNKNVFSDRKGNPKAIEALRMKMNTEADGGNAP